MSSMRCQACGSTFAATRTTAKYCGPTCRKRASRRGSVDTTPSSAPEVGAAVEGSGLLAAVRDELQALGALEGVEGQAAVQLATRMQNPQESGQAVAALSDKLLAAMRHIRAKSAPVVQDEVGTARARREEKRRAAAAGQASR